MQAATIKRAKRTAARLAADTEFTAPLAAYSAEYQRCVAAVMAKTMTGPQMQAAVREARLVRDAAIAGSN